METTEENAVQKIIFSILEGKVTMVIDEEPLYAYPAEFTDGHVPYYGYREIPVKGNIFEPVFVDADTFMNCWKRNMGSVPGGWYHFTNQEGLEVFVDNATGSGHMKAFKEFEDGIDWLESLRRENCRSHRVIADRGFSQFYDPGFDGYDQIDGDPARSTVSELFSDFRKLCEDHGWLEHMTADQMEKLYDANEQGWPIEHIATMIWLCEPIKTDYPRPGFGMERKEILAVLTQYRDLREYENVCATRRLAMEAEKEKEAGLNIEPGEKRQKQELKRRFR